MYFGASQYKKVTDSGVLLNFKLNKDKSLKQNARDIIVAIDAGHGGKYPGAVGPNNILEKDVTLLIAKELERTLSDTKGYQPVMIRDGDQTVSLNDRFQIARRMEQIFLSLFMQMDLGFLQLKVHLFLFGLKRRQVQLQEIFLIKRESVS